AVLEHDLAAHDDVRHAIGALHATRCTGRAVVRDLVLPDADRCEVEHHQVGGQSFADHAAVAETHDAGRLEGVAADRVFEREQLTIPDPLPPPPPHPPPRSQLPL